jgi:hypothetical protein
MTQRDRRCSMSPFQCCMCDHRLSLKALEEFYESTEEQIHGEIYCRSCRERHLLVCRECSGRYTADPSGICSLCSVRMYGMVG